MNNDPETADGWQPPSPWRKLLSWNALGLALVVVAVGVSLAKVLAVRQAYYGGERVIVRLTHWQLEGGYREALQLVVDDYNRLMAERHRRGEIPRPVEVVQAAVTEKVYGQLLNTNLIARSAPDIVLMGGSRKLAGALKAQHFLALDAAVREPNPYNAPEYLAGSGIDPELAAVLPGMPWRDTAMDGMRSTFDLDLQGIYAIPVNFANAGRLSYNKDLLLAATGSEEPPRTLGQLLDISAKLKALGERQGRRITPIAGTRYNLGHFASYYLPFFACYRDRLDLNRDGVVSAMEGWAAFGSGTFDLADRPFAELTEACTAIAAQFPPGFLALERDSATFLFTQGQAAMHLTGSWDAGTLFRLSQGKFRMGIVDFPLPGPGERWGDPAKHPASEAGASGGNSFGVYKFGHVAESIDFLRYLTSYVQNQRYNRAADWVPNIIGTSPDERMAAYTPRLNGIQPTGWSPDSSEGKQVASIYNGQMQALLSGQGSAGQVVARTKEAYADPAIGEPVIWGDQYDNQKTYLRSLERTLAVQSAVAQLAGGDRAEADRRYRTLLSAQVMRSNGEDLRLIWRQTVGSEGKPFPEPRR
ncbi:MAG: extracellular solute-binding protein [Planctomycetes bacterium]|nr:extracellular solute-binding protein [Planctomycetota bacterium]